MRLPVDLRLKPYGMVLPLCPTDKRHYRSVVWYCLCKCGKLFYRSAHDIKSKTNVGCRCQKAKFTRKYKNMRKIPCNNGMVLPLMRTRKRINNSVVWYCLCKCGKLFYRDVRGLLNDKIKSCGCLRSKYKDFDKIDDPSSALTVIEKKKINKNQYLVCKCKCGNIKTFYFYDVVNGRSKSCGCGINRKNSKIIVSN